MIPKGFLCSRLLVLAANREDDPALFEFARPFLQRIERVPHAEFADLDAFHPIVADHAAPDRVVKIEDEAFLERSTGCFDDVSDGFGNRRKKFQRECDLRHHVKPRIVGVRITDMTRQRRDVRDEHLLVLLRQCHQAAVQLTKLKQKRTRSAVCEITEHTVVEFNQIELDDLCVGVRRDVLPPVLEVGKNLIREQWFRFWIKVSETLPKFFRREIQEDELWIQVI